MREILLKIYRKIRMYKNIPIYLIQRKTIRSPKVVNMDKTINEIIKNRYSVSRYGDGEFRIMMGKCIGFQSQQKDLSNRLKEIIKSNNVNHIVCIPDVFEGLDMYTNFARDFWITYLSNNKSYMCNLIDEKKVYYDTNISRPYLDIKDKSKSKNRFNMLKKYGMIEIY